MSKYGTAETIIKDLPCLIEALTDMGWTNEQISVYDTPQQLIDFQGHPTKYLDATGDKAEVIIRRQFVPGLSNDIGFKRNPLTGRFEAIVSAYDQSRQGASWRKKLEVNYAERFTIKTAQKQGLRFAGYGPKKADKRELLFVKG
jgi:hypothetical protein